jgi:hypothetical protein
MTAVEIKITDGEMRDLPGARRRLTQCPRHREASATEVLEGDPPATLHLEVRQRARGFIRPRRQRHVYRRIAGYESELPGDSEDRTDDGPTQPHRGHTRGQSIRVPRNASTCDAEASARLATPNARDRKPPKRSTKLRTLGTLSGANDGASDAEIRAS